MKRLVRRENVRSVGEEMETVETAEHTKPVVGMLHVGALPGTPGQRQGLDELVEVACAEARLYREMGLNCLMLENMHDVPYLRGGVGPEIVAAMTVLAREVRRESGGNIPIGLQILAAADLEALAVAHATGLDFIRTECFCFAHVADEGLMQSNAAKLLRYRRMIGATNVQVWADIKKKHAAHSLTADLTIADIAEAAEFMGAETILVTGTSTGRPPQVWEVAEARDHCNLPVFVGSGVGTGNLAELLGVSDGVIVGSDFKRDGYWANEIDPDRVHTFMTAANRVRGLPASGPEEEGAVARNAAEPINMPPFPRQPR